MIKRDFPAWDFVKNEPEQQIQFYSGTTWVSIDTTFGDLTFNVDYGVNATITVDNSNVYMENLTVTGSAEIPPSNGQVMWDNENRTLKVFIEGDWLPIHVELPTPVELTEQEMDEQYSDFTVSNEWYPPENELKRKNVFKRFWDWLST